jgi:prepilin-type N-terminal cleavage/methylation domain-containing protein
LKEEYQIMKKKINVFNIKKQKGVTLIELMVVVVVLSLIILGLVTFFTGGVRSWITGQNQLSAQRNARQAIDQMVREIREGNNFTIGPSNSVTISYLSSFGKLPVTFKLSGTVIEREVNSVSSPMINSVKTLLFDSTDTSKVHILLEVDVDNDGNPDITLNTDVNLRNYGLGS